MQILRTKHFFHMRPLLFLLCCGFLTGLPAQTTQLFWKPVAKEAITLGENSERSFEPHAYSALQLDFQALQTLLATAPMEFAAALLKLEPTLTAETLEASFGPKERWFNLENHIPVHLSYFTLRVDEDGTIRSYGDVYGANKKLIDLLEL